jgi:hypothetical protein
LREEISHDIPHLSDKEKVILTKTFIEEEVFNSISHMEHNKAPQDRMDFQPSSIKKLGRLLRKI